MSLFLVIYSYVDGSDDERGKHLPAHVAFVRELHEAGKVKLSGPLSSEQGAGGLFVFEAASSDEVVGLLDADPFGKIGVVAERSIASFQAAFGQPG